MAISKVTLNGETLMDVTGNTSGTDNMLYGTKGTAANGTSVTGTIVATPVDDTLSTTSHNAIENAAVATALASKADSSAIPDSTSDLTNDSNFVSDSSYVHTDNNFTTTLKNKLDGIAAGATVDDHKWNDVALTKSTGTTSNNIYVPYMTSTSGTGANLATASTTPTAHYIAKYDANKRLYSTTPTAGDDSTKVATTAFVQSAISALGSILNYKGTKSTVSNLPATGNTTGDVWIVTADSSEHVWNGSSWEQLGTTIDLSGYALASSVPNSTSDLTNDSGFLTSSDLPSWSQASTKPSYTAGEVGAATATHTHGNITNEGDITGNVAIANGDRLVINDESASKINNSSITFGTSTSTFLANNGTWQTPTDSTKVSKSGDTMTGILNLAGSGITFHNSSGDVGTRLYINGTHLSGEEITSYDMTFTVPVSLTNLATPLSDTGATNKKYVDDAIASHYVTAGAQSSSTLGNYATAEGFQTIVSSDYAHAEGYNTTASGEESHAEGYYTTASGDYSHAEGNHTIATHAGQHVFGRFNIADPSTSTGIYPGTYIEIVGNGSNTSSRSNARTLDWQGNEILAGKLTVGTGPTNNMDVATKQYVDNLLPSSTNILSVNSGGTGTSSFTVNSVILANSSTTNGALQSVRSSAGALYSTGQDIKPQFGTLPLEYGGTGYTDAEKPGFFVAGSTNLITNGDFMSVHDWDSSTSVPTGWARNSNLVITDQITNYRRIYLTNNTYGSSYAQMQWVTNQLMSNNTNKYITFSVKYGSSAIRTMTAQVNSTGTAITNNNVEFDNMHLYITPNNDGYITFTIRLNSNHQNLYVYAVKGEFAARQTFQDLYGNLMGSPIPVSSGGTGVSSLPFGDFLGTDETGRILTSRPSALDLDNPPHSGVFNVSSSATTTGTKPYTSAHTGICLVFFYAASNWTEIYIITRTGSSTSGSPANRIFQRTYYHNGTTGTTTAWVEYTHS